MTRPATAMAAPIPAMGNRQQMVEISQFSAGVTSSALYQTKEQENGQAEQAHERPNDAQDSGGHTPDRIGAQAGWTGSSYLAVHRPGGSSMTSAGEVSEGRGAPHSPQKMSSSRRTAPQLSHWIGPVMFPLSPWAVCWSSVPVSRRPATRCPVWRQAGGEPRCPARQSGTCIPRRLARNRICSAPKRWRVRYSGQSRRCPG